MLKVSDKFKKGCNSDSCKYREYIIIDGKQVDIKGNLDATAYKDTTFFGTFNMKMLTFETENDIDYKKKEFVYYIEVDGESVKIGTFIVTDVKDSDTFEQVNVTAYDYGLKFANPYKTNLDYASGKITMLDVVKEICTNCGVELENTTLPNGGFVVDSNQFINNEKYGDVIAVSSLENGMFATINEDDKLEFIFTKATIGEEKNLATEDDKKLLAENDDFIVVNDLEKIEDYVELDDKRDTQPITSVLVATSEELASAGAVRKDQNLINKYGEHWLKIYDYAFAYSSEKCEQLVDEIFNQVKGFGYSSFESSYTFKPYLQLGDKIKFRNKKGELVRSVVLRINKEYEDITLSAPSIINASVEYSLPETAEEMAGRAIIGVNQANAEIRLKVNKDDLISEINLSPEVIELKGNRVVIDSTYFKVDEEGKITGTSGEIGGFNMNEESFLKNVSGIYDYNQFDTILTAMIILNRISEDNNLSYILDVNDDGKITSVDYMSIKNIINGITENQKEIVGKFEINSKNPKDCITIKDSIGNTTVSLGLGGVNSTYMVCNNFCCGYPSESAADFIGTTINGETGNITCVTLTQTSRKENKKNFEKFEGALKELDKIDIFSYNLIGEKDNAKKHLGFVIGEDFKYSELVTSQDNQGVDNYSFTSLCFQMIKEQQEQINELKREIERLKGVDDNG